MKVIDIKDYNKNLGPLISLERDYEFVSKKGSININPMRLLDNPSKYLNKNDTYYIYCKNGSQSRRVVQILEVYGYKVVKVTI